jgi:hypothetical protein
MRTVTLVTHVTHVTLVTHVKIFSRALLQLGQKVVWYETIRFNFNSASINAAPLVKSTFFEIMIRVFPIKQSVGKMKKEKDVFGSRFTVFNFVQRNHSIFIGC